MILTVLSCGLLACVFVCVLGRDSDACRVPGRLLDAQPPLGVQISPENFLIVQKSPNNAANVQKSPESPAGVQKSPGNAARVQISPENAPPSNTEPERGRRLPFRSDRLRSGFGKTREGVKKSVLNLEKQSVST